MFVIAIVFITAVQRVLTKRERVAILLPKVTRKKFHVIVDSEKKFQFVHKRL